MLLQQVFDAAVNISVAERSSLLDEECKTEPALRARVDSLLADLEIDLEFESAVGNAAVDLLDKPPPALGGKLGPYEITAVLGRGEMGIEYKAIRDDEYQMEVAIKVAAQGFLASELRRRFLAERQILANQNHTNIARLLHGGTSPDGLPYLVMKFVEGKPIDSYCEDAGLVMRQRIRLMIEVIGAVEYARRHLPVHRELKPDNI